MADAIRFHLDEHVDSAIARALRLNGIDVTTTAEVGLLGAEDAQHLEFALREVRVVYTEDEDFLRLHAEGIEHAGIVFARRQRRTIGTVVQGLLLIHECLSSEDMHRHVEFL